MIPVWPDELARRTVQARPYRRTQRSNAVRSEVDAGPAFQRRRYSGRREDIQIQLVLSDHQLELFEAFWYDAIDAGTQPFTWTHPETGQQLRARFNAEESYDLSLTGEQWSVTAVLTVRNRPIMQWLVGEGWLSDHLTFERAAEADYTDRDGNAVTAAADAPRYDYAPDGTFLGLLIQRASLAGGAIERLTGDLTAWPGGPFALKFIVRPRTYIEDQVLWQMDDGTESERMRLVRRADERLHLIVTHGGSGDIDLDLGAAADDTEIEGAISYDGATFSGVLGDGATVSASGSLPSGMTTRRIGGSTPAQASDATWSDGSDWLWSDGSAVEWATDSDLPWDGHVKRTSEYPRALAANEL